MVSQKKLDSSPAWNLVIIVGVAIARSWRQFGMNWQLTINQMTQFILEKYERERESNNNTFFIITG